MPLIQPAFINGLIAAEDPPKDSIALAAKGFVDAFIPYVKGATSNGIPITQPTCDLPVTQSALQGGIAAAFALASGPAVANAIGVAILAFFNAGPASAFFTTALGAGIGTGLWTYMSGISAPVPEQRVAKAAVVSAITTWMGAGPAGLFIIFPGSPSDIKAPIL
jgi:hypothetical protein